jgi:RNA recognition motif-containing protein
MEEGTKTKKTIFVGNLTNEVDEAVLLETFATFGMSHCLPWVEIPVLIEHSRRYH